LIAPYFRSISFVFSIGKRLDTIAVFSAAMTSTSGFELFSLGQKAISSQIAATGNLQCLNGTARHIPPKPKLGRARRLG
jgi:hypothetical protein